MPNCQLFHIVCYSYILCIIAYHLHLPYRGDYASVSFLVFQKVIESGGLAEIVLLMSVIGSEILRSEVVVKVKAKDCETCP